MLIVTVDLLGNIKHQGDRTLRVTTPWSILLFCTAAVFSMTAAFVLISVTWYSRKRKWRHFLKRQRQFDQELSIRLKEFNTSKIYGDEDGRFSEVTCDVHVTSSDKPDNKVHVHRQSRQDEMQEGEGDHLCETTL